MTRSIDDMVRDEVGVNVSQLIRSLAKIPVDEVVFQDLESVCLQALELSLPVEDWEGAAVAAGYEDHTSTSGYWHYDEQYNDPDESMLINYESAFEACTENNIEPYYLEVYEHWIVSDWLARQLERHGEKVDFDFQGLAVWARTNTGQSIDMDGVIQDIYEEMMRCEL